jgi:hypothetical protein
VLYHLPPLLFLWSTKGVIPPVTRVSNKGRSQAKVRGGDTGTNKKAQRIDAKTLEVHFQFPDAEPLKHDPSQEVLTPSFCASGRRRALSWTMSGIPLTVRMPSPSGPYACKVTHTLLHYLCLDFWSSSIKRCACSMSLQSGQGPSLDIPTPRSSELSFPLFLLCRTFETVV